MSDPIPQAEFIEPTVDDNADVEIVPDDADDTYVPPGYQPGPDETEPLEGDAHDDRPEVPDAE